jgi:hypothetical protein
MYFGLSGTLTDQKELKFLPEEVFNTREKVTEREE